MLLMTRGEREFNAGRMIESGAYVNKADQIKFVMQELPLLKGTMVTKSGACKNIGQLQDILA